MRRIPDDDVTNAVCSRMTAGLLGSAGVQRDPSTTAKAIASEISRNHSRVLRCLAGCSAIESVVCCDITVNSGPVRWESRYADREPGPGESPPGHQGFHSVDHTAERHSRDADPNAPGTLR